MKHRTRGRSTGDTWLGARRPGLTALAASLLGLLLLLATLQYRWLGQLSAAELERLRTGTRVRTAQFAQEFDREVTRAFLWLRLDPTMVQERDWERLAHRYDRWLREAPHPRLVQDVFWLEARPEGPLRPLRFDPSSRSFAPAPFPTRLDGLRWPTPDGAKPGEERGRVMVFDPIWEEGPALVSALPVFDPRLDREAGPGAGARFAGYAVVLLNREYLLREFIPALVRRHFPATEGLEPIIEITSREDPRRAVYRSGSDTEARPSRPGDASTPLLAISVGEANRDLLAGMDFRREFERMFSRPGRGLRRDFRPVPPRGGPGEGPRFLAPAPGGTGGQWQLVLTHRGGSLEDVVTGVRRRNLLVGCGILVVLGLSVLVTVVATQRAQRLARAEMEFVAGVSHELSTPLSVICLAGENLADGLVGGGEPVRRYGALVRDEGRRLRELVDQVLEFARPPGPVAARDPVDVPTVVDGALEACRPEIHRCGFTVRKEVAPALPRVTGDVAMLRRAVQNLVSNALKYSGSSRSLSVVVRAAPTGQARQVWVTVQDHGLGIEPADLERIFQPFYRSPEARSRQIHGAGLGLSLVHSIVEQHGGSVTVESEPRRGSTFTIRLPARDDDTAGVRHAPVEAHEQTHTAG